MPTQHPQQPEKARVSLPGSERKPHPNATVRGKVDPRSVIAVSIIVKRKHPLDLAKLGGHHLTQKEFAEKYGADPASFDQIRAMARAHGLAIDESASSLERRTVVLRGPATNIEGAFGVALEDYELDGKSFHSYTGTISMTPEHAQPVQAVIGLDNHPIAKPHYRIYDHRKHKKKHKPTQPKPTPTPAPASPQAFNAPQIAQLYNFPATVNGSGQTIGILELGGGYTPSDLSAYFSGLGIAEPKITAVSVDGGANSPGDPNGADGEVALDIEVAGAIAPGANIVVYFTPNTAQGFIDALTTALHDTTNGPPSVISISWGSPESSYTAQLLTAFDDACQSAAALGITVTVASGDSGSSDGGTGNNVDFPASSPHVLGCGGTELIASGATIEEEIVWDDEANQGGATGGGVSSVFALPAWQANVNVPAAPTTAGGRGVPDVAGDAAPETGYNVTFDGNSQAVGGTSAVAPLWAALIALLNQQRGSNLGFINPTLYANPNGCNDITQGNNGAYSAGPGWDPCTGLGSPNGARLSQIFAPATGASARSVPAQVSSAAAHRTHAGD